MNAENLSPSAIVMDSQTRKPARLSVVIGSGGVMCAASLGMWKVFKEEEIDISMVVGCSGGSLYAAVIALGYALQTAQDLTLNLWTSDLFGSYAANLRTVLVGESRFTETSGLIDDQPMLERLKSVYGERRIEDTHIPLYILATDLYSGESLTLSSGRVVDAVRASIAIPLIFPPWEIDGRLLVDGAVSNPLPVDVAIKEGAEIIVAIGFELPTRSRMRSYTAVTSHFNNIYMNNILKASYAFHNAVHHAEIIPILPEFERHISGFDTTQIPHIIEEGARATRQQIPYLRRLLASFPVGAEG